MAGIVEAMRSALGECEPGEAAARLERELEAWDLRVVSKERQCEPERCGRCGGLRRESDHESSSDRVCRCGGRKERMLSETVLQ